MKEAQEFDKTVDNIKKKRQDSYEEYIQKHGQLKKSFLDINKVIDKDKTSLFEPKEEFQLKG